MQTAADPKVEGIEQEHVEKAYPVNRMVPRGGGHRTEAAPERRAAGLLRHEVINLISSEKSHSGRECPIDRTGMSEGQKRQCSWILEPGSKRSKLASFSHS